MSKEFAIIKGHGLYRRVDDEDLRDYLYALHKKREEEEYYEDEDEYYEDEEERHTIDDGHDHRNLEDDSFLTPEEKEYIYRRQKSSAWIQAASTGAGALLGYGLSGGNPIAAGIGGGAGNWVGQHLSPMPGQPRGKDAGKKILYSALAGGLSPILFPWGGAVPAIAGALAGGLAAGAKKPKNW